ncbi:AMP-binding protein [Actinopolymorpha pittospori]|uniref:Long-subunit acyl-CoA synthetase (AMP-forming) n=1 Tax=Actinopolymorpha pittospori TaxID=648752 RepID=A0A927RAA9_9ACTN|nr:AMP-binding protein [Actinopolymorpha pittospori]MBE1608777.1 long-subunit acyl-CoA synthetase (AMP-forming) [Actinopolymorpha pittospori]
MSSDLIWGTYPGPDPSKVDDRASTVAQLILDRFAATPEEEAFRRPVDGGWASTTWRETGEHVRKLAAGLISLGIQPEERVAIASSTRYEWVLADLAVMCAGGATTTIYPTTTSSEVSYILGDSHSRIVFAEDDEQLKKIREHRSELPEIIALVTFDGVSPTRRRAS